MYGRLCVTYTANLTLHTDVAALGAKNVFVKAAGSGAVLPSSMLAAETSDDQAKICIRESFRMVPDACIQKN